MDILYLVTFIGSITSVVLVGSKKIAGSSGLPGAQGSRGLRGPRAVPLSLGPTGPTGPTGSQGLPGPPGEAGAQGLSNAIQQVSIEYIDFDQNPLAFSSTNTSLKFNLPRPLKYDVSAYLNPSTSNGSGTSTTQSGFGNSQVSIQFDLPIVNPQGPSGIPGALGPQGILSQNDLTEFQGPKGPIGPTGPQGATGPTIGTLKTAGGLVPVNISLLTTNLSGHLIADNSITTQDFINGPTLLNGFTEWASGPYEPGQNVVVEPNIFYSCTKATESNPTDLNSWAPLLRAPGTLRSAGYAQAPFSNRARCFGGQDILTLGSSSPIGRFTLEPFATSGSAMIYLNVIIYNNVAPADPFCQMTFFSSDSSDALTPMISWDSLTSGTNRFSISNSGGVCTITFSWDITSTWAFDWFVIIN